MLFRSPKTLALVSALGGGELASAVGAAMRTGLRIRVLLIGTEAAGTRATLGRLGADVSTASTPDEVARALGPVSAQYVAA